MNKACDGHTYNPDLCRGPVQEYVVTESETMRNDVYSKDAPLPQRTFSYCPEMVEADRAAGWIVQPAAILAGSESDE